MLVSVCVGAMVWHSRLLLRLCSVLRGNHRGFFFWEIFWCRGRGGEEEREGRAGPRAWGQPWWGRMRGCRDGCMALELPSGGKE